MNLRSNVLCRPTTCDPVVAHACLPAGAADEGAEGVGEFVRLRHAIHFWSAALRATAPGRLVSTHFSRRARQEAKNGGAPAAEAREIALYGGVVVDGKRLFINKLDGSLASLKECECVRAGRHVQRAVAPVPPATAAASLARVACPHPQEAVALHQQHRPHRAAERHGEAAGAVAGPQHAQEDRCALRRHKRHRAESRVQGVDRTPPSSLPPPPAERLEDVAGTLEELWLSYNGVSSLDGLATCSKLRVLYMSNNQARDGGGTRAG
jgi:hypothetical protein